MNVVITGCNSHGIGTNNHALNQGMWVVAHDVAIFKSTRLALIAIANQIFSALIVLGHEAPLQAGWEACASTTS